MQYYIDLLENRKSKFRVFVGLSFLVVAVAWVAIKLLENETIETFDWIYSGIFALNALVHTMGGLGFSIEGMIGKRFIKIDYDFIALKLRIYEKEKTVSWENIQAIEYRNNQLFIHKKDNSYLRLALSRLEYSIVQEIKRTISDIAVKKGVQIQK
jgi:uncharacterized membrane protein YciS (DUF1049 family)